MKTKVSSQRVALVTGSGRRLGRKIAIALAKAGFDIVVNYNHSDLEARKTVKEIIALGRRSISIKADVSRRTQVKRMVQTAVKEFGRIDVLVNNAAIFPRKYEFAKIPEKVWNEVLGINLSGSFFCAQEVAKVMLEQKSGHIINLASLGAFLSWPHFLPYNVSKSGIVMLTKTMAKALAPDIHVNAIAPGTIIIPNEEKDEAHMPSIERIPFRKYGKPSDITEMIVFLVNSTDYVTGQIFTIDGGATIP